MSGPTLPVSMETHAEKYRGPGESYRDSMYRVANALKDDAEHYHATSDIMLDMRFWGGGRVQSAMGSTRSVTPYNCFVSGTIEDSFVEGNGSIMARALEAAATMRQGGGIGYDFSNLRPKGALIRKLQSASSGPLSFMEIFDSVCRCVASSGHRRGAQMGVMRIDHPDIEEFIHVKGNQTKLTGFNLSVAVTDEFMNCLAAKRPFPLQWGGQVFKEVDPEALWDMLMRSTWDWAEPGVLFIDRINEMNNLWYCEKIVATNPCGEQPLPPYGACLLGSFNLTKYLEPKTVHLVGGARWEFDHQKLLADIPHVVRAMDNVVDRAKFPLYEQEQEAKNKRRMGLGVMGLANAGEALGFAYGTPDFIKWADDVTALINRTCYLASAELAKEKGSFRLFDKEKFLASKFVSGLDDEVKWAIAKHGIRNSHLTSIAPTGTISLCADNVSSGVEPVFSHSYNRTIQSFEGPRVEEVTDYGYRVLGVKGRTADQVTPAEHVAVLNAVQKNVDSAVSKTCNVGADVSWDAFKQIYLDAYQGGAKGCTTFRAAGKRMGVLVAKETPVEAAPDLASNDGVEGMSCRIDGTTGRRECD